MKIIVDEDLKLLFPNLVIGYVLASVAVCDSDEVLISNMDELCNTISVNLDAEKIRQLPIVSITKQAYRKMGNDPNRYRISSESLLRRLASGKGLYRINNMVDVLNMVSVKTGYSIGGYDADKIVGDISFGKGKNGEPYEGIGRGALNIENLPVFRDEVGAFGTSTSDSVRTMVTLETRKFLMLFPCFENCRAELNEALQLSRIWLEQYGNASEIQTSVIC